MHCEHMSIKRSLYTWDFSPHLPQGKCHRWREETQVLHSENNPLGDTVYSPLQFYPKMYSLIVEPFVHSVFHRMVTFCHCQSINLIEFFFLHLDPVRIENL